MRNLSILLAALSLAELVHTQVEIWGMRQKLSWLAAVRGGTSPKPWPVDINTKFKTVVLHLVILILFGGGSYLLLWTLSISNKNYLVIGATALLLNYGITTWKVDCYHSEIGKIIAEEKLKSV